MTRFDDYVPAGVIPATLLAFDDGFAIDEQATRDHLRDVAGIDGISAIAVNAHASEVHACTFDEQRRVLDLTMEEIGDFLGITRERVRQIKEKALLRLRHASRARFLETFIDQ